MCDGCSSKRERVLRHGFDARVRVCNVCHPQALRENEYHERHLPMLTGGSPFVEKERIGSRPIIFRLDEKANVFTWQPAKLERNQASQMKRVPTKDVSDLTDSSSSASEHVLEIVWSGGSLKLICSGVEEKQTWLFALRECLEMNRPQYAQGLVGQDKKQEIERQRRRDEEAAAKAEHDERKAAERQARANKRDHLRDKYNIGGN